jgi:hypothetical protein
MRLLWPPFFLRGLDSPFISDVNLSRSGFFGVFVEDFRGYEFGMVRGCFWCMVKEKLRKLLKEN